MSHRVFSQLTNAGVPDVQAEAILAVVEEGRESLATKADLQSLATKEDLQQFATKEDLQELRDEFRDLKGEFVGLRGEFHKLEMRLTLRFGTLAAASVAAIAVINRL